MKTKRTLIAALAAVTLLLGACAPGIPNTGSQEDGAAATQQAVIAEAVKATSTTMAMLTQIAQLQTEVARPTATVVPPTATALPPTLEPTATLAPPTATPVPPTPIPTATRVPPTATATATAIPLPCNDARFVSDITIGDGAEVFSEMSFTKTWRLRNTGACTWTRDYALVFISGTAMGSPAAVSMPRTVAPGESVDISVDLRAPKDTGVYRGYWMLRDASGALFGSGAADEAFYTEVRVTKAPEHDMLQLSSYHCQAEWTSSAGRLPCMGESGDERGYIKRVTKPVLETGYVDDEPALVMHPQMVNDGVIRGAFPRMRIEEGWHFTSIIGCSGGASRCDVRIQLDYRVGNGEIRTLKRWAEVHDDEFHTVDVDLSKLAGKDVSLILTVLANGSSRDDEVIWLAPRIKTSVGWGTSRSQ